ncbi:MAG: hypothetical protein AAFY82_01620 [Pseudomonadota bacterium]
MPKSVKPLSFLVAAATLTSAAYADGNFAVTGGIGTMGGSVEGQVRVSDFFQLRGGVNYLTFDETIDVDEISYDGELDFSGFGAFVDLHPFRNSFFVTGGAYAGDKTIDLLATSEVSVEIGDLLFTPAEYGRLEGDVSFDDVAPFVGAGFDTTFQGDGNWGFHILAGAALYGSGDVTLEAVGGTLSNDPLLQAQLEQEIRDIEEEIEDYEVWPVVQIGLSYRF